MTGLCSRFFSRVDVIVFSLVAAAFVTIYIPQPVLPLIQNAFGVNETLASLTISAVILGITLANIPFGILADAIAIGPIILSGGTAIFICSVICAFPIPLGILIAFRLIQGLFIPALTTCLAAYLSRSLPPERLNVVMGSYVSATVLGGLGGRLLGGWIQSWGDWRLSFLLAGGLVGLAMLNAWMRLPPDPPHPRRIRLEETGGFTILLRTPGIRHPFLAAFCGFFIFSSIFNYLPFYLAGPAFGASTRVITLLYLSYIVGIFIGPLSGRMSNRYGNAATMAAGSFVLAAAMLLTLIQSLFLIPISLTGVCAGFFTIHASAAGWLNRQVTVGRGRANSLYVLFYYAGGAVGITVSGMIYEVFGWPGVMGVGLLVLTVPLAIGVQGMKTPPERKTG